MLASLEHLQGFTSSIRIFSLISTLEPQELAIQPLPSLLATTLPSLTTVLPHPGLPTTSRTLELPWTRTRSAGEPISREIEDVEVENGEEGGRTIISSNFRCEEGRADWKSGMAREGRTDKGSGLEEGVKRLEMLLRTNERTSQSTRLNLTRRTERKMMKRPTSVPSKPSSPSLPTPKYRNSLFLSPSNLKHLSPSCRDRSSGEQRT